MLQLPKRSYWIFVVVGFLVVVVAYYYHQGFLSNKIEPFETEKTTTTTTEETGTEAEVAAQAIVEMPQTSHLKLYLSAFTEPTSYQCTRNYWCDSQRPTVKYFLMNDALPTSLQPSVGLAMQKVFMRGPAAYTLSSAQHNYTLGSFTVAFYASIKDIDFTTNTKDIVILDVPAQTPNRITFMLSPVANAPSKVAVKVVLGSVVQDPSVSTFTWTFEKATLIGDNRLFAFTFDKANNKIGFYHGNTMEEVREAPQSLDIILGVTELTFNKNLNLAANLIAFMYYDVPLSAIDLGTLATYCSQHSTGYVLQVRAKESLEGEVQTLLQKVQSGEDRIRELLNKINTTTCPNPTQDPANASVQPKWLIKLGAAADGVSALELGKCSPLAVKKFGDVLAQEEAAPKADANVPPTKTVVATDTKSDTTTFPRKVPYPPKVTSSTSSQAVTGASVVNPAVPATPSTTNVTSTTSTTSASTTTASTPTTAATTTPTVPSGVTQEDREFWTQFFGFLQNQQNKNATMSSTSNVDLNQTYDALRKEASTDKTQPGNLLFTPVVQDPAKTEPAPVQPESKSWWDNITSVFLN